MFDDEGRSSSSSSLPSQQPANEATNRVPRRVDHTYHDYANYRVDLLRPSDPDYTAFHRGNRKSANNFPAKLHSILSNPEYGHIIRWMPHGRAWKIFNKDLLVSEVIPKYWGQTKYESFSRQLSGWGFKRLHQSGPDFRAYYHECFLRGLPFLTKLMKRVAATNQGKLLPHPDGEPNFYDIDFRYPLPDSADHPPPPNPPMPPPMHPQYPPQPQPSSHPLQPPGYYRPPRGITHAHQEIHLYGSYPSQHPYPYHGPPYASAASSYEHDPYMRGNISQPQPYHYSAAHHPPPHANAHGYGHYMLNAERENHSGMRHQHHQHQQQMPPPPPSSPRNNYYSGHSEYASYSDSNEHAHPQAQLPTYPYNNQYASYPPIEGASVARLAVEVSFNNNNENQQFHEPPPPIDTATGHAELEPDQMLIRQRRHQDEQSTNSSTSLHPDQQPSLDQDIYEAFKTPEDER